MAPNFTLVSGAGLPVWRSGSVRTCHPGGIAPPPATRRSGSAWADRPPAAVTESSARTAGARTGYAGRIAHQPRKRDPIGYNTNLSDAAETSQSRGGAHPHPAPEGAG